MKMKKFCIGLGLAVLTFLGIATAVQAQTTYAPPFYTTIETPNSKGKSVTIFQAYTIGSTTTEWFVGSTTTNGGSNTVNLGKIDLRSCPGSKTLTFYAQATAGTGTLELRPYGFFGTGSAKFSLPTPLYTYTNIGTGGTSTVIATINDDLLAFALGAKCTWGTLTVTAELTSIESD